MAVYSVLLCPTTSWGPYLDHIRSVPGSFAERVHGAWHVMERTPFLFTRDDISSVILSSRQKDEHF